MLLVFALTVSLNGAVDAKRTSYWFSLTRCNYFARHLMWNSPRTSRTRTPVLAYCIPKYVNPKKAVVHD
jgi:hypothetical protein